MTNEVIYIYDDMSRQWWSFWR